MHQGIWVSLDGDPELKPLSIPDIQIWFQPRHEAGAAHEGIVGRESQLLGGRPGSGTAAGIGVWPPIRLHLLFLVGRGGEGVFQGGGVDPVAAGPGGVDLDAGGIHHALAVVNETLVCAGREKQKKMLD